MTTTGLDLYHSDIGVIANGAGGLRVTLDEPGDFGRKIVSAFFNFIYRIADFGADFLGIGKTREPGGLATGTRSASHRHNLMFMKSAITKIRAFAGQFANMRGHMMSNNRTFAGATA